jgi:methionyl-tRNA formyltransferase
VRATTHPYPGAFAFLGGRKLYVWKAREVSGPETGLPGTVTAEGVPLVRAGRGGVELLSVQLEGEEEMDGSRFARTHNLEGLTLGGKT